MSGDGAAVHAGRWLLLHSECAVLAYPLIWLPALALVLLLIVTSRTQPRNYPYAIMTSLSGELNVPT